MFLHKMSIFYRELYRSAIPGISSKSLKKEKKKERRERRQDNQRKKEKTSSVWLGNY